MISLFNWNIIYSVKSLLNLKNLFLILKILFLYILYCMTSNWSFLSSELDRINDTLFDCLLFVCLCNENSLLLELNLVFFYTSQNSFHFIWIDNIWSRNSSFYSLFLCFSFLFQIKLKLSLHERFMHSCFRKLFDSFFSMIASLSALLHFYSMETSSLQRKENRRVRRNFLTILSFLISFFQINLTIHSNLINSNISLNCDARWCEMMLLLNLILISTMTFIHSMYRIRI